MLSEECDNTYIGVCSICKEDKWMTFGKGEAFCYECWLDKKEILMDNPKVVHCKKEPYDIYIGRGKCPTTGKKGKWGNPFTIGKDGNREEVIKKYKTWLMESDLVNDVRELKGKVLGCWCSPQACHGDILIKLANEKGEDDG